MRAVICDRCGARIMEDKAGYINLDMRDLETGCLDGEHEFDKWDLCEDCMKQIEEFVRRPKAPVVRSMTESLVKDMAPVEIKKEKPAKATVKKPIAADSKWAAITPEKIERIRQLVKEGKTVKAIADEVGCSDPTVRKYKREVTPPDETEETSI